MAHKIKAINAYCPRIDQGATVQKRELVRALSRATSVVEGSMDQVMNELKYHIIEYCRAGRAVKVEGLGTWSPSIALDGTLSINYRPDPGFTYGINQPGEFTGPIINQENIGKTSEDLVTMWNDANPDDQVELAPA